MYGLTKMNGHLLHDLIDYLGLELPVYVELRTIYKKGYDAYYMPKYSRKEKVNGHIIKINLVNSARTPDVLLAHELIHAWQEENGYNEIHGKHFKKMARKVEKAFGLTGVYISTVDN